MSHARLLALSTALGGALLLSACGSLFGPEATPPLNDLLPPYPSLYTHVGASSARTNRAPADSAFIHILRSSSRTHVSS